MKNFKVISFSMLLLATMLACSAVSGLVATPTPAPTNTPLPTSTPLPTLTPLPSPTPDLILFEDTEFTNSCSTENTKDVERFTENGQFNMRVIPPSFVGWAECTKVEFTDFILEADATQVGGPDNNIYGLLFRYGLDAKEFYTFAISGDGYYVFAIDGPDRTEPQLIAEWTKSPAINLGAQTNHLKVIAVGDNIKYYVNDQLLGESQDGTLDAGTVGFFVGSIDEGDVQISFDNLKVSKP